MPSALFNTPSLTNCSTSAITHFLSHLLIHFLSPPFLIPLGLANPATLFKCTLDAFLAICGLNRGPTLSNPSGTLSTGVEATTSASSVISSTVTSTTTSNSTSTLNDGSGGSSGGSSSGVTYVSSSASGSGGSYFRCLHTDDEISSIVQQALQRLPSSLSSMSADDSRLDAVRLAKEVPTHAHTLTHTLSSTLSL